MFVAFPSLFSLAANKEALVVDIWESFGDGGSLLGSLDLSVIENWKRLRIFLSLTGRDVLLMKDVKDGRFSVKHFYLYLSLSRDSLFPLCFVCNPLVPTKVGFFAGKLLVRAKF